MVFYKGRDNSDVPENHTPLTHACRLASSGVAVTIAEDEHPEAVAAMKAAIAHCQVAAIPCEKAGPFKLAFVGGGEIKFTWTGLGESRKTRQTTRGERSHA